MPERVSFQMEPVLAKRRADSPTKISAMHMRIHYSVQSTHI